MKRMINDVWTINKKEASRKYAAREELNEIPFDMGRNFLATLKIGSKEIHVYYNPDYVNMRGYICGCIHGTASTSIIVVDDVYMEMPLNIRNTFVRMLAGYAAYGAFKYGKYSVFGAASDMATLRKMHFMGYCNVAEATLNADRFVNPKDSLEVLKWLYRNTTCPKDWLRKRAKDVKAYKSMLASAGEMKFVSAPVEGLNTVNVIHAETEWGSESDSTNPRGLAEL